MATVSLSKPTDYGAPAKFSKWRDGQEDLFLDMVTSKLRFDIRAASTGSGKSVAYVCAASAARQGRTVILTNSKALQDQLAGDFNATVFDMRGLANYPCKALQQGGELERLWIQIHANKKRSFRATPTCDIGPCRSGIKCGLKDEGCDYFDAYTQACKSRIVSTNYAYWIAINRFGQGLGKFDRLVLDECQHAQDALVAAMSADFTKRELRELGNGNPPATATIKAWRPWARMMKARIAGKLDFYAQSARIATNDDGIVSFAHDTDVPDASELFMWKSLEAKCTSIAEADDTWVVEKVETTDVIRLSPPWVGKYSEELLFRKIPRVTLVSATVRPKTGDLLGIPPGQRTFKEYPSTFPRVNRPVYWLTTVRLSSRSTDSDMKRWVQRIDQILDRHLKLGHKGIIHTVSYARQQFLYQRSRFAKSMIVNSPKNTPESVQAFREAGPGTVLVSPTVTTGYDFPDDMCRFQILGKIPFRDARGAVEKAQVDKDADYLNYLTVQEIIQTYGRALRSETDAAVTWIVDDHIEWFVRKYKAFFTDYFLEALLDSEGNIPPLKYVQNASFPAAITVGVDNPAGQE